MAANDTYSVDIGDNHIKIYINNILHIAMDKSELVAFQSWGIGDKNKMYSIEFTFKTTTVLAEYNKIEKWKAILDLLNKELVWSGYQK